MIETEYDGEPMNFKGRIVIFGCLTDLNKWPKSREEVFPWKYQQAAENARDYLERFDVGRVTWIGPGIEAIWNYSGRGLIWDPWSTKLMEIIAESNIAIFRGGQALKNRYLMRDGLQIVWLPPSLRSHFGS